MNANEDGKNAIENLAWIFVIMARQYFLILIIGLLLPSGLISCSPPPNDWSGPTTFFKIPRPSAHPCAPLQSANYILTCWSAGKQIYSKPVYKAIGYLCTENGQEVKIESGGDLCIREEIGMLAQEIGQLIEAEVLDCSHLSDCQQKLERLRINEKRRANP